MAANRVSAIPELLLMILEAINDEWTLLHAQRVSRAFKSAIDGSPEIQRKLCFSADLPAISGALECGHRINPLIAVGGPVQSHLISFGAVTDGLLVPIRSSFMIEPAQATGYAYRPRYPVGSWRRMYLVQKSPTTATPFSFSVRGIGVRPDVDTRCDGMTLGEAIANAHHKGSLVIMGFVHCIWMISSDIKAGSSTINSTEELDARVEDMILTCAFAQGASEDTEKLSALRHMTTRCTSNVYLNPLLRSGDCWS